MNLKNHLIATGLAALPVMTSSTPLETTIFCVGSILIDVDHQIFYSVKTGRFDISGMFRYFREEIDKNISSIPYLGVCIFHTIEFFLFIAILSHFFPPCRYLLAGMIFHIILDIYALIRQKMPFIRAYSLIEHFIRRRKKGYPFI